MKKTLIFSVITLSGCATIFSPNNDQITLNSIPQNAVITIDGNRVGRTPSTVLVKRQLTPPRIEIKNDGYYSRNINLQNTVNPVTFINVLFWPGFIVDAITGNMMKAQQFNYEVELEKK